MTGIVKFYKDQRNFGYGFILGDGKDHYFTKRDWKEDDPPIKYEEVTFDPVKTSKGFRAKHIRRFRNGE